MGTYLPNHPNYYLNQHYSTHDQQRAASGRGSTDTLESESSMRYDEEGTYYGSQTAITGVRNYSSTHFHKPRSPATKDIIVIMRDMTGKHVWRTNAVWQPRRQGQERWAQSQPTSSPPPGQRSQRRREKEGSEGKRNEEQGRGGAREFHDGCTSNNDCDIGGDAEGSGAYIEPNDYFANALMYVASRSTEASSSQPRNRDQLHPLSNAQARTQVPASSQQHSSFSSVSGAVDPFAAAMAAKSQNDSSSSTAFSYRPALDTINSTNRWIIRHTSPRKLSGGCVLLL